MGSFTGQVRALIDKDFHIAKRSKIATACEFIVPIFAAVITGVFIMLVTRITTQGDEYSDATRYYFQPNNSFFVDSSIQPTFADAFAAINQTVTTCSNTTVIDTPPLPFPIFNAKVNASLAAFMTQSTGFGINATKKGILSLTTAALGGDFVLSAAFLGDIIGSVLGGGSFTRYPWSVSPAMETLIQKDDDTTFTIGALRKLYLDVNLRAILSSTGALLLLYAFIPSAIVNGGRLVTEKKAKVRESLRVMGINDSAYLLAHAISMFIRLFVGCSLIAFILAAFTAIEAEDIPAVLGISVIFCFSMITEAMMMPALFSADVWTNVFNIFFITGAASLSQFTTGSDKGVQILVCLMSPGGYYYAVLPYLAKGSIQLALTPAEATLIMCIDTIVYFIIATYVYNVAPGENGVPKEKLYFISWLWKKKPQEQQHQQQQDGRSGFAVAATTTPPTSALGTSGRGALIPVTPLLQQSMLSADKSQRPYAVYVRNLVKQYPGAGRNAVDGLDFDVRKGECVALLGHNGAGKTTACSAIVGVVPATSYDEATVAGYDLMSSMDEIRQGLGYCPQFDVLYDDLTCREHLELFARLKDYTADDPRINELIELMNLPVASGELAKQLSGGTRRRLSLACALVGRPTLLIADEPSSGMDPVSRRRMYEALKQEKKKGTSIILCTHFLEEADAVGDRIAIMARGKMQAFDASTALKHKYDVGNTLICTKGSADCDSQKILALLRKHVPETTIKIDSDSEVQFLIKQGEDNNSSSSSSSSASNTSSMTALLVDLEEQQRALQILSYGIDACTLEDVFLKLAADDEAEHGVVTHVAQDKSASPAAAAAAVSPTPTGSGSPIFNPAVEELFESKLAAAQNETAFTRIRVQIWMTLTRLFLMLRRDTPIKVFAVVFPLFLLALGFLTLRPNEGQSGAVFKSFDWVDLRVDESSTLNLCILDDRNHDLNAKLRSAFEELFVQHLIPASTTMTREESKRRVRWFPAKSYSDFSTGQFVPLYGFTFTGPKSPAVHGGIIPHSWNTTARAAHFTFLWNPKYNPALATVVSAVMRMAVDSVTGNVDPAAATANATRLPLQLEAVNLDLGKVIGEFVAYASKTGDIAHDPLAQKALAAIKKSDDAAATASGAASADSSDQKTYNVMVLGLYFVLAVGQLVAACCRGFNDELSRKVVRVLMLNNMHPLAHLISNVLFAFIMCLWPLLILVVGVSMVGIDSLTNGGVMGPVVIAALLFMLHTCLDTLVYMTYLPGKTPVGYTVMVHGLNLIMMGAPYIIDVIMNAAHAGQFRTDFRPFLLSFFPPCAFYHVLDVAASVKPAQAAAWRLFAFGTDEVTETARTGYCFLFLALELIVPAILLHNYVYDCGAYSWLNRKRAGIVAPSDHKYSMGEQQQLLDDEGAVNSSSGMMKGASSHRNSIHDDGAHRHHLNPEELEDADVRAERARASRQPSQLVLDHVRKVFEMGSGFPPKVAVHNLSLALDEGTTLGLLGPNSAGKTTTCNMIVRQLVPTSGSIDYMRGRVSTRASASGGSGGDTSGGGGTGGAGSSALECYQKARLGICMQDNTLFGYLDAKEHVEHYLKMRLLNHYDENEWKGYIADCLTQIHLDGVDGLQSQAYSGGMKRKLQVVLAMCIGAKIVLADEPSSGMDPHARRSMWAMIKNAAGRSVSIILTTHSMEEAEATCGRIAIMTGGVMRCIGSPQHLKSQYGANFVVTIELDGAHDFADARALSDHIERMRQELSSVFQSAQLVENVGNLCKFQVSKVPSLAQAFQYLDKKKVEWFVRTYAVSQMVSLEQIFVNFVKTSGVSTTEGEGS